MPRGDLVEEGREPVRRPASRESLLRRDHDERKIRDVVEDPRKAFPPDEVQVLAALAASVQEEDERPRGFLLVRCGEVEEVSRSRSTLRSLTSLRRDRARRDRKSTR